MTGVAAGCGGHSSPEAIESVTRATIERPVSSDSSSTPSTIQVNRAYDPWAELMGLNPGLKNFRDRLADEDPATQLRMLGKRACSRLSELNDYGHNPAKIPDSDGGSYLDIYWMEEQYDSIQARERNTEFAPDFASEIGRICRENAFLQGGDI